MITVELTGGLGNQLFQFAAGYSLAKSKKVQLGIDLSWFKGSSLREPLLMKLQLKEFQLIENKILNTSYFNKLRDKVIPYYRRSVFVEQYLNFDSNFFKATDNAYLIGYWQTEKYFIDYHVYLQSLVLNYRPDEIGGYSYIENLIIRNRSVGVHVRRGDYLLQKNMNIHGVCSIEYYEEAINYMRATLQDPFFLIFSDDIDWCKKTFSKIHNVHFIEAKTTDSVFELSLLCRCHSQIISNSTYGWWGAWLNNNPDKIVIAPRKWFVDEKLQMQTFDLLPVSWLTF